MHPGRLPAASPVMTTPKGTLYVVATPLGNLEDITARAIRTLSSAHLVACEDTRRTRGLLAHFGIDPPRVISYHKFNEKRQTRGILAALERGEDVALVSDGGTPGVSDPGALVVLAALESGLRVSPVPGPSAAAAAISVCGFAATGYLFAGFLPARGAKRTRAIRDLAAERRPIVLLEAPHRIGSTAADLLDALGDRDLTLLREATKLHEEVRRTSLSDLAASLRGGTGRGEYTLVLSGSPAAERAAEEVLDDAALRERHERLIAGGVDRKEAFRTVVKQSGRPRDEVYALLRGPGRRSR